MSASGLSTEDCKLLYWACRELHDVRTGQSIDAEMASTRAASRKEAQRYEQLAHIFLHAKSAAVVSREGT